jgi:HAD superfamily hydrolase (TIGR01509 family)
MARIEAIVFDFDGVIANSEPLHLRAYQQVLAEEGLAVGRDEYYARYLGYDDPGAFRAIARDRGRTWTDAEIAALIERKSVVYDALLGGADVLYPQAAACVARLAARFPLGIASGAMKHEILAILEANGLHPHFRFVVASGDTARSKPAPDPYARAAALHGLPAAACLAVEDSRWGIESAKDAGLRCVAVTTTYAAEELGGADAVIASLDELTPEAIDARFS